MDTSLKIGDSFDVRQVYDPLDQAEGFSLLDPYVELVYGPLVGPTGILLARLLARVSGQRPYGADLGDLAAAVGVKTSVARSSIGRLVRFGLARIDDGDLVLRAYVRPVGTPALTRLPQMSLSYHHFAMGNRKTRAA